MKSCVTGGKVLLLFFLFSLVCVVSARAQDTRATILGTVTDQNGAVIQGVTVNAVIQATGRKWTTTTDSEGLYRLSLLPAGTYDLTFENNGFQKQRLISLLDLRVGEERRIDTTMYVAGTSDAALVEAPVTDSALSTLSTVIPSERVAMLPLNGRQLQELALTAPGVTASGGFRSSAFNQFGLATPADGNAGAFSINGAPSRANGFFLDGTDINVPEQGVIAFPPLVEATREFQVQTSLFNAEYGRYSGSIVNLVTKSGTNAWHGSVYEYFRNDALDANDFFNNANGLSRTVLKQNQYGVALGGPLRLNKHFIFGNWEANKVRQGTGPFASNVPTAEQRRGLLRYNTTTGATATLEIGNRLNPITQKILDQFIPLPNANTAGANYIASGIQKMDEDAFTIRTDSQLTDNDLLTARYLLDDQRQFYPFDIFFISASLPAFPFPNPERRQSLALSHTHTFSNRFINEVRFGLNRQRNPIPSGTTIDPASIGLPNGAPQNEFGRGLPVIRVAGFGGTGGQPLTDNLGASTTNRTVFQLIDNISLTQGRHSYKFGGELRRTQVNSSAYRPIRGSLTFNGTRNGAISPTVSGNAAVAALADFLLGLPAQATISSANPTRGFRTWAVSSYAQDEWRVNNRLTLNLGLRYEIDTPLTEVNGLLSNLIPGRGNFVVGSPELPRLHRLDTNNFAPRAGFACRVTGDGRWTVRGGGGVFYDNGVLRDRFDTARTNAPFAITAIDNNPIAFPNDGSPATTLTRLIGSGRATSAASIDVNYRTPYALQYNLNVQREVAHNTLAEIAYVGRRGLNASRRVNINQIVAAGSIAATQFNLPVGSRPYNQANIPEAARFANDINQQQYNGQATYHSLQARLERRLTSGSSFLAAYTWSRSIDDVSGIGTGSDDLAQDSYNLRAQRAVSNYDIPHRFVLSSTWALPVGKGRRYFTNVSGALNFLLSNWQINSITTYQSGQPFTVIVGAFDAGTGTSNRRPIQISDPLQNVPAGFAFNPAAFAAPASGQFGNVGRNTLRGDGYRNTDFALLKQFPIRERANVEFRAELFNVYNEVNFTLPVSARSNAAFGRYVSNATAPRIAQFALKFQF
jgi:hypothetical protein